MIIETETLINGAHAGVLPLRYCTMTQREGLRHKTMKCTHRTVTGTTPINVTSLTVCDVTSRRKIRGSLSHQFGNGD